MPAGRWRRGSGPWPTAPTRWGWGSPAAAAARRQQQPARIVVAVPVAAASTCDEFRSEVDEIVCAAAPEPFYAVGMWYDDFSQTSDEEVHDLLERARHPQPAAARSA